VSLWFINRDDAGKVIKGRKWFMSVYPLGLALPVLVTAANVVERTGSKQVLPKVKAHSKD